MSNLISEDRIAYYKGQVYFTSVSAEGYILYECGIRVISINIDTLELRIPAWHYYDTITVDISDIPIMFFGVLLDYPMMWAKVNLDALRKEDLIIKDYTLNLSSMY